MNDRPPSRTPMGLAEYKLHESLSPELQGSLSSIKQTECEIDGDDSVGE